MPPIFKALASITVWILFVNGCLGLIGSATARIGMIGMEETLGPIVAWAIGVASLILAVLSMKLRQMLE